MGEAEKRIHKGSQILLTNPSPHLPAIELEKKPSFEKLPQTILSSENTSYIEIREQSDRHNFLAEHACLIFKESNS
jgi:hypothetical protein